MPLLYNNILCMIFNESHLAAGALVLLALEVDGLQVAHGLGPRRDGRPAQVAQLPATVQRGHVRAQERV